MPTLPHPVAITLLQSDGTASANQKLRVINRNTGNVIFVTTDSEGHAVADLANWTEGYTAGDPFVVEKVKTTTSTTKRFEGKIDGVAVKMTTEAGETLYINGGHIADELLDLTVTKEYNGDTTCDAILKDLIDTYLTGYTYVNVEASTETPNIKWSNKPFWEAVEKLCEKAVSSPVANKTRFDCRVDDDKDFHFFEENSKENTTDAIVWNDTLLSLDGFGEEHTLVKNKIITYGTDASGLPIINTALDIPSKDAYGLKEMIITNGDIGTVNIASDIGSATLSNEKDPKKQGSALCFWLPTISPGEKIWISEPTSKITEQNKIFKFSHYYPAERTEIILTKKRDVATLFRDRILKDIAQDVIINPYEMTHSLNFTFDDFDLWSAWDTNIEMVESKLKLSSGTTGTITSDTFPQDKDITACHLLVNGINITDTVFKVSTDGGETLNTVTIDALTILPAGANVVLKIFINNADTQIDGVALLVK